MPATSRRSFLLGTAAAAVAPVLPASEWVRRSGTTMIGELTAGGGIASAFGSPLYGRSPAMECLPDVQDIQRMIDLMKDFDPIEHIDWQAVDDEMKRLTK